MIQTLSEKLVDNISTVVRGKKDEIKLVVGAMLAGGHVLLEDVPGTGKTILSRALAKSVDCGFKRVQFTPDLLPSDITGINFYNMKQQEFVLRKGPVFTNILLADEINRATPRTQSALLECMEELQTTIDGETYPMDRPFFVIATQNPTETQGTYPLPEAQLDRFMIRLTLGYPSRNEEVEIISAGKAFGALEELSSVCTAQEITEARGLLDTCKASEAVCGYIADIAAATRDHAAVKLGLSTRGAVALKRMSAALAMMDGRDYITPEDVAQMTTYVLPHRIHLTQEARVKHITVENVVSEIMKAIKPPFSGNAE